MIYTVPAILLNDGIRLDADGLRSTGIYRDSTCYMVQLSLPEDVQDEGYRSQEKHLILSPAHPSVWPFLVRVRVYLEDKPKMLEAATELMARQGVNLFASECVSAGYRHAVWTCLGLITTPAVAAHPKYPKNNRDWRGDWSDEEIMDLAKAMGEAVHALRKAIFETGKEEGWLRQRLVDGEPVLLRTRFKEQVGHKKNELETHLASTIDADSARELVDELTPEPVEVRWLNRMAYYSVYRSRTVYRFRHRDILEADTGTWGRAVEVPLPGLALASFHTRDKYVRFEPLRNDSLTQLVFDYEIRSANMPLAGRGLLHEVIRRISQESLGQKPNMIHHSQQFVAFGANHEQGRIDVVVEVAGGDASELAERIRKGPVLFDESGQSTGRIENVRSRPYGHRYLFVSTKYTSPNGNGSWLKERAREIAEEIGFRLVPEPAITRPITDQIVELLRRTDALLLIGTARHDDPNKNMSWLHTEYAVARARDIPAFRLLDLSCGVDWEKELQVDRDTLIEGYYPGEYEETKRKIHYAISELYRLVGRAESGRAMS